MTAQPASHADQKEKTSAALSSVVAAIGLTTFKVIVGVLTNSLGILAEAAHSALDLVAALVTFIAVRISDKPADPEHRYGHGKVENFSALIETLLLLATCAWIIYESLHRLLAKEAVAVDVTFWSFLVMAVSIVVDFTRSRVLAKAAKKFDSQALEADALHFSTDIWSSSVVIVGLIAVSLAKAFPGRLDILHKADAAAALIVAGIVIYVSIELGLRTVQGLLDQAPKGLADKIEQVVEKVPGVADCHAVRVRTSGPALFVDLHIYTDPYQTLAAAHTISQQVTAAVRQMAPRADVTVHVEPTPDTPAHQ
jgi:cation diffusion facilitator family transporter